MVPVRPVLPVALRRRAEAAPDTVFLTEVGGRTSSYGDLDEGVARWTAGLRSLGVAPGEPVATMLPNSVVAVEVWLGLGWLRAIEVPVNPAYRGALLAELLADSTARVLVIAREYWDELADDRDRLTTVETVVVVGDPATDELLVTVSPERPTESPVASDLATILYTSGTTGRSKGVMVPWHQLAMTVAEMFPAGSLGDDDVYYSPYPPFHLGGKMPIHLMAVFGGSVILRERFSTRAFWDEVAEHGCTTTCLLGSMAHFLWNEPVAPGDAATPLRNVLMIPLVPDVEQFKTRFGVRVTTLFNMTEISCPIRVPGWELVDDRSCGTVRPGYEVRLSDSLDRPVTPGTPGELLVRADEPWALMAGYWRDPGKTVEAWRNQWLHTGDVFVCDERGNYYFVDRLKDAIRRRGENISSFEVERAIEALPGVGECAVVAVASDVGEEEVKAVVVPVTGVTLAPAELVAALAEVLPRFMVPRYVELTTALPRTETQKVLKSRLREDGVTHSTWDAMATRARG